MVLVSYDNLLSFKIIDTKMLHVLWVFVAFAGVEADDGECGVYDSSDWFSAALCSQVV